MSHLQNLERLFPTPHLKAVREIVSARRIAAHAATTAVLASLSPEQTADTWTNLGDVANRVTGKLARCTGRDVP